METHDEQQSTALQVVNQSFAVDPVIVQAELDNAYEQYRNDMTSEEAQKTLLEIVVLSSLLAERIKKLSNANIVDARVDQACIDWQRTVRHLTSEELINGVNAILQSDTQLLDSTQLANLELVLGRSLYKDGVLVPIEPSELRTQLMPQPQHDAGDASGDRNDDSTDDGNTGPIHIPVE